MISLPIQYFDNLSAITQDILSWYDRKRRSLPWRCLPNETPNPYYVWLSEIMLQQTSVFTVIPYFYKFISRWPTIASLAQSDINDVLTVWSGLGYYARARNLHTCAQMVVAMGGFPKDEKSLRSLPGIGSYTAAAISAIAFGQRAVAVDSNIERVVIRLFSITEPLPSAKRRVYTLTDWLTPTDRCGDFIQAVMDLGATLCKPRHPSCILCPIQFNCLSFQRGVANTLPYKSNRKKQRQILHSFAFCTLYQDTVLMRRRPLTGLLGGMLEIPSTPWRTKPWSFAEAITVAAPCLTSWKLLPGSVCHNLTHRQLKVQVALGRISDTEAYKSSRELWIKLRQINEQALPVVTHKTLAHALLHTDG